MSIVPANCLGFCNSLSCYDVPPNVFAPALLMPGLHVVVVVGFIGTVAKIVSDAISLVGFVAEIACVIVHVGKILVGRLAHITVLTIALTTVWSRQQPRLGQTSALSP